MLDLRLAPAGAPGEVRTFARGGSPDALRGAAAVLGRELAGGSGPVAVDVRGLRGKRLTVAVEGLLLGSYRPPSAKAATGSRQVALVGADDEQAVADGVRYAAATGWARDLANTPASVKSPQWLADQAARELSRAGLAVEVRPPSWLAEQGFGGVLAVASGSPRPPRFVEASWRPRGARPGVHVVLVGKGITFDTGGLNLKPGGSMRTMHTDMAGGAAVFAALRAIAAARIPVRVSGLVPMAENAFGGGSFRPGDVVRHVGGRTSEITNTDAEGRLVLADALAYATRRLRPTVLVDIATLTGAMKVALGLRTAGFFATTDALAAALINAGASSGEPLWRMPLASDYAGALHSVIADADNAPGNPGGITAALFLQPFTGGLPWAHLDIAGPGRAARDGGILSRGATGFGARLLTRWVESLA